MLLNSRNGQTHPFRYLIHRKALYAPQDEHPAGLRGQIRDDLFEPPQLVAGVELGLRPIVVAQGVEIRDLIEGDHGVTPCGVDQHVAGDHEEIGPALGYAGPFVRRPGPCQGLGDQIVDIGARGRHPPQARPKRAFMRENDRLEPLQTFIEVDHGIPL